ncbi:MAG: zf-TFIIB domain-containing protein [Candidatus Xenobiia bacterium LiM19]
MNCPLCRIAMKEINISGVNIDECTQCHGLWFDNLELARLDETIEGDGETLERILSYPRDNDRNRGDIVCPRCSVKMHRRSFYYKSDITIDDCYGCGGTWLDAGELDAVRNNFKGQDEREAIFEQMISTNEDYLAMMKSQTETQQKTMAIRQKGLLRNLVNICFSGR